jgi:hypothetical protein
MQEMREKIKNIKETNLKRSGKSGFLSSTLRGPLFVVAPSPSSFRNNNLSEDIKKLYLQINKERERERTCSELVGVREGVGLVAELSELEAEGGEGGGGELDGTLAIFFILILETRKEGEDQFVE